MRRQVARFGSVVLFTLVIALLVGCGGSTTTTTTKTTSPTAELEQYRAELKPKNEAIESAKHNLEKVRFTGSNYSEVAGAFTTYMAAYHAYLTALEQTQAPIAVAKTAENYIARLRQGLTSLEATAKAAAGHEGSTLNADLEKARATARECTAAGTFYAEACRW